MDRLTRTTSRITAVAVVAVLTLTAACSVGDRRPGANGDPGHVDLDDAVLAAALRPFDDCDALLDHLRREALERVGPYGLDGEHPITAFAEATSADEDASSRAAGEATGAAADEAPAFSGTNVQEAGVDEPDIVKTDGKRLVSVVDGTLRVVDVSGAEPREVGSLRLSGSWGHQLLVRGDTALVMSGVHVEVDPPGRGGAVDSSMPAMPSRARLVEVDLSDPATPSVTATMAVDGDHVSARMVGDVVRAVVRSAPPRLGFVYPSDGSEEAQERAEATNRAVVERATLDQWLPAVTDGEGDDRRRLTACDQVHRPAEFSGFGTVSVVTVDLGDGLAGTDEGDAVSVLAGGDTVYGSTDSIYVATNRWVEPDDADDTGDEGDGARIAPAPPTAGATTTELHRFDTSGDGPARYRASGSVEGHLLNQFSMSEHEGHLRVATTVGRVWGGPGEEPPSESVVTTLAADGDELVEVGQVGGLGKGERIYAVRFVGDVGYVVTFRQVDPLYTLDLSDPADPRVVGELKIPGFSTYLHPVGDGLVLGVGQDATDEGRTTGAQVSLFDVSDPAAPVRRHQHLLGRGTTEVEYDHRAFLWWGPEGLAVLPLQVHAMGPAGEGDGSFSGAVGVEVDPDAGISERGRVSHPTAGADGGWRSPVRRSIVLGDRLYTVSDRGIHAVDLTTFADRGWLPFG